MTKLRSLHIRGRAYDITKETLEMFKKYRNGLISRHFLAAETGIDYSDILEIDEILRNHRGKGVDKNG